MTYIANFERIEKKYWLTGEQLQALMPLMREYMEADAYGETTIGNLYLDTEDDLLVRRSIEKPVYKEKMRLRSYGVPNDNDPVYLEIKKKVQGVVYKRRMDMTAAQAMAYLTEGAPLEKNGQIPREIDYMKRRYGLYPKLYLAYDRTAYQERQPSRYGVRVTVDRRIRSRDSDVDLRMGDAGRLLTTDDRYLMEVKTAGAYPLWLTSALTRVSAHPVSFSKYGLVYGERARNRSPLTSRLAPKTPKAAILGGFNHAFIPV